MRSIVYYYTHLQRPCTEVGPWLAENPRRWLPSPAEPTADGWLVALHADGALPRRVGGHMAEVRVGPATRGEGRLLLPISWRSATAERLVPVLEADLELATLDGYGCRLALMGSYRPPLPVVGQAGDRLLGHRVAEACVRRFVLDLAERAESATLHA